MMKKDDIRQLTDRFFEGRTTLEEERRLQKLYRRSDLPEDLLPLRAMFRDLEAVRLPRQARVIRWKYAAIGIAAAILLLFGAVTFSHWQKTQQLTARYGGSYMIVNGERIDDLNRILPTIKTTLAQASSIEHRLTNDQTIQQAERELLNAFDNPAEREEINRMLND